MPRHSRIRASAGLGRLDGRRVGVVCNPASVDGELRHIADRLAAASARGSTRLAAIFGPQHGFRSDVQENMIETGHARDDAAPRAGLLALQRNARADRRHAPRPRRARHRPAGRRHAHLHLHLHDGQLPEGRAGSTASTVIVCDRPNPIGGVAVEGPMLVHGLRVVRRALSDPDAARHDDRRARAARSTSTSASAPTSRSCRWRAGSARCISTRPGCRG